MQDSPETRDSLLVRLRDHTDGEAWGEFVAIYRPMVYRFARRRGFQDADAQDLVQRVLLAVSVKIEDWSEEGGNGRFRAWLSRVSRNALIDAIRRVRPDSGRGGTNVLRNLAEQPDRVEDVEAEIQAEYEREVFRWAAHQVRNEFETASWDAFWLTTVEGEDVSAAAQQLNKSVGSIYTARSRVMRRLQEKVREYEDESE